MTQDDQDICPYCEKDLSYEFEGNTYSRKEGHEIRGAYDGVLFWACPYCGHAWQRWPKGERLHKVAQVYIDRRNARTDEAARDTAHE